MCAGFAPKHIIFFFFFSPSSLFVFFFWGRDGDVVEWFHARGNSQWRHRSAPAILLSSSFMSFSLSSTRLLVGLYNTFSQFRKSFFFGRQPASSSTLPPICFCAQEKVSTVSPPPLFSLKREFIFTSFTQWRKRSWQQPSGKEAFTNVFPALSSSSTSVVLNFCSPCVSLGDQRGRCPH